MNKSLCEMQDLLHFLQNPIPISGFPLGAWFFFRRQAVRASPYPTRRRRPFFRDTLIVTDIVQYYIV